MIEFQIELVGRRGTATPPAAVRDHWTYHHVLPWRYYFVAAYICCQMLKAKIKIASLSYKDITVSEDPTTLAGKKYMNFSWGEVEQKTIFKAVQTMHTIVGQYADVQQYVAAHKSDFSPADEAYNCICPSWGGFCGPNGDTHRLGDPGSGVERVKPHSFPIGKWSLLQTLERQLNAMCRRLSDAPDAEDRTYAVSIADVDKLREMVATITKLNSSHNHLHQMNPADWDYKVNWSKRPWTLVDPLPAAQTRGKQLGKCIQLNGDGKGNDGTNQTRLCRHNDGLYFIE